MRTANELDIAVTDLMRDYDVHKVLPHMTRVGSGQLEEVVQGESIRGFNRYYQWLACLMKLVKPKQVVELGAAAGISTIMMATELPKDSKLISVDIDKDLAWKWMDREYPQVIKVLGDDLDLGIYPKDIDLDQTDIWFIDSLHTEEQLRKEFALYRPFWKKGAIVVLDDIKIPGLDKVWSEITEDKCETTVPNHYTGFGHFIV